MFFFTKCVALKSEMKKKNKKIEKKYKHDAITSGVTSV